MQFENLLWLWGLIIPPILWVCFALFQRTPTLANGLDSFIDAHLLPHLLLGNKTSKRTLWQRLCLWSVMWSLLMVALAGPRWDYREIETFAPDQNLVILLDLSQSMDVEDVQPSRLVRARQKIEDILSLAKGVNIGLIAFAADPHMISPLTDDVATIRHLLPTLDTSLVYVQGSKLVPALTMASRLLDAHSGSNKSILVITDGGFEDASAISKARELYDHGTRIYTMGVGTLDGGPIRNSQGELIKQNGAVVMSKLEIDKLRSLSNAGGGGYLQGDYHDNDIADMLQQIKKRTQVTEKQQHTIRLWEERFYLLVFPMMILLLLWFRKGFVFLALCLTLPLWSQVSYAKPIKQYFQNDQQIANQALERGDYATAIDKFRDPYRKGVAQYKAGNFAEAETLFRQSERADVATDAAYNLGNALAQQQKYSEAIKAYEALLQDQPQHEKAKHNLDVVKKLLEQQQAQQDKENNKDNNKSESKSEEEKEKQETQDQSGSGAENDNQDSDSQSEEQTPKGDSQEQQSKEQSQERDTDEESEAESEQQTQESQSQENDQQSASTIEKSTIEKSAERIQQDIDADQWLNRVNNNPQAFLKNQFYIESKRNGTTEERNPW